MAQSILVSEHHLRMSLRMKRLLTLLLPGVVSFFWVSDSSARAEMLHFSWAPDPVVQPSPAHPTLEYDTPESVFNLIRFRDSWICFGRS